MVQIEGILTKDRRLLVDIPDTLPAGRVRIIIDSVELDSKNTLPPPDYNAPLTREEARRRLAAAGLLSEIDSLTEEEEQMDYDWQPVILPLGSPGSEVLVDEDRGER